MTPRETSRDLLARAMEQVAQALAVLVVETVEASKPAPNPDEELTGSEAARQFGRSPSIVAEWCRTGAIDGAYQSKRAGTWRFRRSAFEACLRGGRRRRRLRVVA